MSGERPADGNGGGGSALWQLTLARFREFYREPAAVFWVYGFPLVLAFFLGLAFRDRPVERITVDVQAAGDTEPAAARLRDGLAADDRIKLQVHDAATCRERLRTAKTDLVVVPAATPPGYEYLLDPNRPGSVLARNAAETRLIRLAHPDLPTPAERTVEEPGGRYIDFLIPGLVGMNLLGGGLWGVGFVTVDMRVRKLLKRLLATPLKRPTFLLSIALSRLVFSVIDVLILLTFAYLFFDVRVRGNPLALLALIVSGAACFSGLGLLVASRAKTIETASGLMNLAMLPMYVLSGVFFSSEQFPDVMQPFIRALPLTGLNEGLRAVVNEGKGWAAVAGPVALTAGWGAGCFALALKLFRWR